MRHGSGNLDVFYLILANSQEMSTQRIIGSSSEITTYRLRIFVPLLMGKSLRLVTDLVKSGCAIGPLLVEFMAIVNI